MPNFNSKQLNWWICVFAITFGTCSVYAQQPCKNDCADDGVFVGRNFFRFYNVSNVRASFWFEGYDTLTLSPDAYKYFNGNLYRAEIFDLTLYTGYTHHCLKLDIDKILRESFWRRVGDGIIKWKSSEEFAALLNELRKLRNVPYTDSILAILELCEQKLNTIGLDSKDREVYSYVKDAVITIVTRNQWDLVLDIENSLRRYTYRTTKIINLESQFEITKQLRWQLEHSRTIGGPTFSGIPIEYVEDKRNFPLFSSLGIRLNYYRNKRVNTNPRFFWSLEYIKSGLSYFDPADTNLYKGYSWHNIGIKNGYLHVNNISKRSRPGSYVGLRLEYGLQFHATREYDISPDSSISDVKIVSGPGPITPNSLGLNLGIGIVLSIKHFQMNLSVNTSRPLMRFTDELSLQRFYFLHASVAYPIKSKARIKYRFAPTKTLEN